MRKLLKFNVMAALSSPWGSKGASSEAGHSVLLGKEGLAGL